MNNLRDELIKAGLLDPNKDSEKEQNKRPEKPRIDSGRGKKITRELEVVWKNHVKKN